MGFKFGKTSAQRLSEVHEDLQKVMNLAITYTEVDFGIAEGLRTLETQKKYLATGATTTLRSRHLTSHAVDVAAFAGKVYLRNAAPYHKIKDAVFRAAKELNIPIRWGGDWDCDGDSGDEKLFDGPHFELPRSARYP